MLDELAFRNGCAIAFDVTKSAIYAGVRILHANIVAI